ncbi:MAG: polysaccharide deacetylase family protein [Gammaproteobacteria bacterium]|nr:polysaccharide deacetylase family protein [Gammaproteobacteria bacterium]
MPSNNRLMTFLYHEVCDNPEESGFVTKNSLQYTHTIAEFEEHLSAIAASETVVKDFNEKCDLDKISITFDDGGISALCSAEMLEKYGWRGHYFIATKYIGQKGFLSSADISDLRKRGHYIGSHSHSHPKSCRDLSFEALKYEWENSKKILEDILSEDVFTASIPNGQYSGRTLNVLKSSGYSHVFTSMPTVKPWNEKGLVMYGRFYPKRNTSRVKIEKLSRFEGVYFEYLLRKLKQTLKLKFKG